MLALFLAIALLGTDGAYGRSTIDLTGDNHDNTDLGGSELHAKAGAYYGGDDTIDTNDPALTDLFANKLGAIDFTRLTRAKLSVDTLSGSLVTASSIIGLAPPRPSLLAPPASPSPPSPSPPPTPKVTDWHITDYWVYDPVDGEITGHNPNNPDVLASELAGIETDPCWLCRTTDEKMAKAKLVRDDPYWGIDDPRALAHWRDNMAPLVKAAFNEIGWPDDESDRLMNQIGLTTSKPSPPTPLPSPASPPPPSPSSPSPGDLGDDTIDFTDDDDFPAVLLLMGRCQSWVVNTLRTHLPMIGICCSTGAFLFLFLVVLLLAGAVRAMVQCGCSWCGARQSSRLYSRVSQRDNFI